MSVYKLTCFLKEGPATLYPLLRPLNFQLTRDQSMIWTNGELSFQITPLTSRGRGLNGYHISYRGNPESCSYLMDQFLGAFDPLISGIEWVSESDLARPELIRLSEKANFMKCSLLGLYEHKGVGIVLLPNSEIHLQIRCRQISNSNLPALMSDIMNVAAVYEEKPIDLFSFAEERSMVYS